MADTRLFSIRTLHPTTNWRLPAVIVRYAERLFETIDHQVSAHNAWRLYVFLCKKQGHLKALKQVGRTFPIDKRKLALIDELGLSEGQVQRAIVWLRKLGLVFMVPHKHGYTHRKQEDGSVWKLPSMYRFSSEMVSLFWSAQGKKDPQPKREETSSSSEKGSKASLLDRVVKNTNHNLVVRRKLMPVSPKEPMPLFPNPIAQLPQRTAGGTAARPSESPRSVKEPFTGASIDLMPDSPLKAALARLSGVMKGDVPKVVGQKPDFCPGRWVR